MSRTLVVLLAILALSADAQAQDRGKRSRPRRPQPAEAARPAPAETPPKSEAKEPDQPAVQVEQSGRKRVYRIKTEFVIEGRIQKPNAFYVLQRSNINYEWVDLKQEFTPRILQSVRESPF